MESDHTTTNANYFKTLRLDVLSTTHLRIDSKVKVLSYLDITSLGKNT